MQHSSIYAGFVKHILGRIGECIAGTRAKENDKKRRIDGGCSSSKGIKFKMRQKQEKQQ